MRATATLGGSAAQQARSDANAGLGEDALEDRAGGLLADAELLRGFARRHARSDQRGNPCLAQSHVE